MRAGMDHHLRVAPVIGSTEVGCCTEWTSVARTRQVWESILSQFRRYIKAPILSIGSRDDQERMHVIDRTTRGKWLSDTTSRGKWASHTAISGARAGEEVLFYCSA